MCFSYGNRKDEIDVIDVRVIELMIVMKLDEGVRKQKLKMGEFNNLYDEKEFQGLKEIDYIWQEGDVNNEDRKFSRYVLLVIFRDL